MTVQVTNVEAVLDPWADAQQDSERVRAVVRALMDATDNFDELLAEPATFGHPLKRVIEVPDAEVLITVLLGNPIRAIHLLSIDSP